MGRISLRAVREASVMSATDQDTGGTGCLAVIIIALVIFLTICVFAVAGCGTTSDHSSRRALKNYRDERFIRAAQREAMRWPLGNPMRGGAR